MADGRHRLRDGMCEVWTELMWLRVGTGCGAGWDVCGVDLVNVAEGRHGLRGGMRCVRCGLS